MLRTAKPLLRGVVYGVFLSCAAALGCGAKGCSCTALASHFFSQAPPEEKTFSDVEVLDTGSEPRVTLRVARWPGLHYRMTMVSKGALALEGQPLVFGPTVVMAFENEVLRGSGDPIIERRDGAVIRMVEERSVLDSLTLRYDQAPKPLLDAWNLSLAPLRGTTFLQRVTETAGVAELRNELLGGVRPPDAVRRAVDASLEVQRHFPFRLPSVPVGIGAHWRFREPIEVNGAHVTQVSDMTLKGIFANDAVIGLSLLQEAPRQEVPHPLVPGAKAVLEQFRGDGEGEMIVDRITAIVVRGHLDGKASLTLSGDVQGHHGTATLVGRTTVEANSAVIPDLDGADEALPEAPQVGAPSAVPSARAEPVTP